MKGIVKLKVPAIPKTPKLYVITLSRNSEQRRFKQVSCSLEEAVEKCWYSGHFYTMKNYIAHTEITVPEINQLFKDFKP